MAKNTRADKPSAAVAAAPLGTRSLITVVSAIVLVAAEFFALALAAGWAIAGLLELGQLFEYIFMVAFGLLAAWATIRFARSAWRLEGEHRHS
ncbi:hypothetical protein [Pseudochelatococcus contaminans]|uniref:Signaling protein n=1 Tax=Pseudochelatococcus contaminans TaxID=1538103 RepID=A0A7W5Z390_9HYPH|nr:hypothetical protein [Pseudochelatococcus contaminans]MBB3809318.1 hypothetical protein [Pseudochelatococcus contaminans]